MALSINEIPVACSRRDNGRRLAFSLPFRLTSIMLLSVSTLFEGIEPTDSDVEDNVFEDKVLEDRDMRFLLS